LIHETSLLSAVRTVIRADSDPVRQAVFANLNESHLLVTRYDASYARPPAAIETDVRAAIQRLRYHAGIGSIDA
jgi:hypothetical protein